MKGLLDFLEGAEVIEVENIADLRKHLNMLRQKMQGQYGEERARITEAEVLFQTEPFALIVHAEPEEEDDGDDIDAWLEEMDQHGPDPFDELDFAAAMNWPDEDDEPDAGPEEDEPEEYETWIASIRLTQQNHRHPAQLLMVVESETRMLVMEIQDGFFLAGWRGCQLLVNLEPKQPLTQELVVAAIKICTRDGDFVQEVLHLMGAFGGIEVLAEVLEREIPQDIVTICMRLINIGLMPPWHLTGEVLKDTLAWSEELGEVGVLDQAKLDGLQDRRAQALKPYEAPTMAFIKSITGNIADPTMPRLLMIEQTHQSLMRHVLHALQIVPLAEQQPECILAVSITMMLMAQNKDKHQGLSGLIVAMVEATDFALTYYDGQTQTPIGDRECRNFVRRWIYGLPQAEVVNPLTHGPF